MTHPSSPTPALVNEKLIVRGIHLELTDAIRAHVVEKTARLLRHNDRLVRIRIDLEHDRTAAVGAQFIAKGHIEIGGPDLIAHVASEDGYKSIDQLIDKLDRMLRERSRARKDRRDNPAASSEFADTPSPA